MLRKRARLLFIRTSGPNPNQHLPPLCFRLEKRSSYKLPAPPLPVLSVDPTRASYILSPCGCRSVTNETVLGRHRSPAGEQHFLFVLLFKCLLVCCWSFHEKLMKGAMGGYSSLSYLISHTLMNKCCLFFFFSLICFLPEPPSPLLLVMWVFFSAENWKIAV